MNVLIVVTHLLGTGHLARALTLARAVQAAGDRVLVVSGGMPAPQLDLGDVPLHQLLPLRSDGVNFSRLLDEAGKVAAPEVCGARKARLVSLVQSEPWDVVITELFPFGRRSLSHEFRALLETAHALPRPPVICASIRDILAPPSKPEKAVKADAILAEFYDAVLVHADAALTPLDLSWPVSPMLQGKLHYTGLIAPPAPTLHPKAAGKNEILVTAGGGAVGGYLFEAALGAARHSDYIWRILLGGPDAAAQAQNMMQTAPENVVVEPARPDFRQMLNHAAACVCMCGYNTALDVLQTGCPAVFVPFDAGTEVEQTLRARALADLDGIRVLPTAGLNADTLTKAVDAIITDPQRANQTDTMQGAHNTAKLLKNLAEART